MMPETPPIDPRYWLEEKRRAERTRRQELSRERIRAEWHRQHGDGVCECSHYASEHTNLPDGGSTGPGAPIMGGCRVDGCTCVRQDKQIMIYPSNRHLQRADDCRIVAAGDAYIYDMKCRCGCVFVYFTNHPPIAYETHPKITRPDTVPYQQTNCPGCSTIVGGPLRQPAVETAHGIRILN